MKKEILSNSLWMMSEKIISVFGLLFVVSYVAKYVGPNVFGEIAFATSLFQITQIISQLGSDVIVLKRLSSNPASGIKLINATLPLRAVLYMIISIPVMVVTYKFYNPEGAIFVFACFISCFFMSLDVFSLYFDSRLESFRNTLANVTGLIAGLAMRWLIVYLEMDYAFLALPIILTGLIPLLIRVYLFRNNFSFRFDNKRHKRKYVRYLVFSGSTFVVSSLSVAVYTRISMLLLGYFAGSAAVGVFAVAVTLAASWSFICNALITSTLPSIFSEKNQRLASERTTSLNRIILGVGIVFIGGVTLLGNDFIHYFYGEHYLVAYPAMIILSFSTLLSALGTVSARYIARSAGYAFLSKKMLSVAMFSVLINIPLIYYYGLNGAAVATLITEFLSLTLFNYLFKKGLVLNLHLMTFRFFH